ncbi:MAG TPA: hypothetical protein VI759_00165 [Dehalococcoidia bacterium]|nr:hypothetical protein [Dehalococcoidia bacterium]
MAPVSRRAFLRDVAGAGLVLGGIVAGRTGWSLVDQHETWEEASLPNDAFFNRHAADLDRLTLGGTFAPEQWTDDAASQAEALAALGVAVRQLGINRTRLGLRWSRSVDANGAIDLAYYRPTLDYCVANGVDLCLNVGPVRVFRWPEDHIPQRVMDTVRLPEHGARISPDEPLAVAAFDHLDRLLDTLRSEYGAQLTARLESVQLENEPFYHIGQNRWRFNQAYMQSLIQRVDTAFPATRLLTTSAGRLNLNAIRDLYETLLRDERFAGRLVSGFDFHYQTPTRDSYPIVRYFDQISYALPFSASAAEHLRDARRLGFSVEVTEGQAEPYGKFTEPGNSVKHFRFLILRCLDKVLDRQAPALIRVWGVEALAKKMLRGELTDEHRDIIAILQRVNGATPGSIDAANR